MMEVVNLGAIVFVEIGARLVRNLAKVFRQAALEDCIIFYWTNSISVEEGQGLTTRTMGK